MSVKRNKRIAKEKRGISGPPIILHWVLRYEIAQTFFSGIQTDMHTNMETQTERTN